MGGNWRKHLEFWGGAFIVALVGAVLARLFLTGSLLAFLQMHIESPEAALTVATLLFGASLVSLFALGLYFSTRADSNLEPTPKVGSHTALHAEDYVHVRHSKGVLYLDPASVCDQVFIAISKVQQVKCTEVDVYPVNGDAHVEVYVQVESAPLLEPKHAELRTAIQEMAARLHIQLSGEPVIYAKLPPLRGGRTVSDASVGSLFSAFKRPTTPAPPRPRSIFGTRPDSTPSSSPSSIDGEAPSRSSGSIFGYLRRRPKPEEPDDDQ
jgi:hypothetical protein